MPEGKSDAKSKPDAKAADETAVEIDLEMARGRLVFWTVFGIVVGALLVWKLGTVGRWAGVVLIAVGIFRAWLLVQTFLNPPGTIVVTDTEVSLPRGLCTTRPVKVARQDVSAVYFLRRSVPWHRTAPVLVIELNVVSGGAVKAMVFPRDWFASEADQRHIVHALLRGRPGAAIVTDPDESPSSSPTTTPTTPETAAS